MIYIAIVFIKFQKTEMFWYLSASDSASDSASTSQEIKPEDSRSNASHEAAPPKLKKTESAAAAQSQTVEGVTKDETGEIFIVIVKNILPIFDLSTMQKVQLDDGCK